MKLGFFKKINKLYIYTGISVITVILLVFALISYIRYVDKVSQKIETGTDLVYILEDKQSENDSFYVANIKDDLNDYITSKKLKNIDTITYKINNEDFYFLISVNTNKNDEYEYSITKIVNETYTVNARMNYKNIDKVYFRSNEDACVLRIVSDYDANYFAMSELGEYFLGDDIDEIVYKNERFYYIKYNSKYKNLVGKGSCSNKVTRTIEDFSYSDDFYKMGKINFMEEYYQKIYTESVSVKNYCNSLK